MWVTAPHHANDPQCIRCDVAYYRQLAHVFEIHRFDYVYHCANEFGRKGGEEFYESLWNTNAVGMRNLLSMQEHYGFGLIYPGSAEMYASAPAAAEHSPEQNSLVLDNDYTISKWVNELQIRNSIKKFGAKTVRIRFSSIYGPGEYYTDFRSAVCIFIYRALHDMPYTVYTDAKRPFLFIDDAVNAAANIPAEFQPGSIHTVTGEAAYDMKYISDMILKILGKDDHLVEYKKGDPTVTVPRGLATAGNPQEEAYIPRTSLEEGIAKTIAWQKEIYKK